MERKEIKLDSVATDTGEFEGYGSVFGNVDQVGGVVVPGAYAKTLPKFSS